MIWKLLDSERSEGVIFGFWVLDLTLGVFESFCLDEFEMTFVIISTYREEFWGEEEFELLG